MRQIAEGVWLVSGFPRALMNVYLVGDVLIDAATRWAERHILAQLRGRTVRLVALTHCHPDHQGAAHAVCARFGVPLACHEADVPAMEGMGKMLPDNWVVRLGVRFWAGRTHPVRQVLREGDEVAGFRVIHTPGHTPGHVLFFRESDRVAIAGDLLANVRLLAGLPGLREPPSFFSVDPAQNRRSIRILAELRPRLVFFGHGQPLRDPSLLEKWTTHGG
jgi:hydroxyacylglutathione hydrolase